MSQPSKPQHNAPKKPQRLLYPPELTQRHIARLQLRLRQIFHDFRKGKLTRSQAQTEGEAAIKASFEAQQADVKTYIEKHGLTYKVDRRRIGYKDLQKSLEETLARWQKVVNEYF